MFLFLSTGVVIMCRECIKSVESLVLIEISHFLVSTYEHRCRLVWLFIHTLAPLAVRALVCINLSFCVSVTLPLTSKPPPELSCGGGLLASTWYIEVVKM